MTKALLNAIKSEYEYTDITIKEICEKYSCETSDLKGYTKWEKNPDDNIDTAIKLVYDTIYSPEPEDDDYEIWDLTPEVVEAEIVQTANDIKNNKPVKESDIPAPARDGFEGLRKLDVKLQSQALTLLSKIDTMLDYCETTRDIRDLVASHTSIRDSYFNSKAPMVNILNGNVMQADTNALAELLNAAEEDC